MAEKNTVVANNKPVGGAGQPFPGQGAIKKEIPEGKKGAIARRMAKKKADKK